jgi:thiol-disulfide isomerase/thioredoxin
VKTLVVYHAEWCGPCRQFEKTLAEPSVQAALAAEGVLVQSIDVDHPRPAAWTPTGGKIPTFALVEGRTVLREHVGYLAPSEFKSWLKGGW